MLPARERKRERKETENSSLVSLHVRRPWPVEMAGRRGVRNPEKEPAGQAVAGEKGNESLLTRQDPLQHQWSSGCRDRRGPAVVPLFPDGASLSDLLPVPPPARSSLVVVPSIPRPYRPSPATLTPKCPLRKPSPPPKNLPAPLAYVFPTTARSPVCIHSVGNHRLALCSQSVTDRASVRYTL